LQVGSVDLRTLDRHPGASISSLIPSASCRRCSPHAQQSRCGNNHARACPLGAH
jgi:hypothetical protein